MTEIIVSFQVAKLAKEKGFDILCSNCYRDNGVLNSSDFTGYYPAPTQSLLQKFIREVYNIDVWAQPFVRNQSLPDESYSYYTYKDGVWVDDGCDFLDFEEALEKGLFNALKLIQL